jgi:hypothetical protein
MSAMYSVPSGALAKSTGRNQLSVLATNSIFFSSAGRSATSSSGSLSLR